MLSANVKLRSALDLLLGLEFKSVQIFILKKEERIMEGTLYQNIKKRTKSRMSYNIRKQDGTGGGLGLKYRMATKLIDYAI